MDKIILYYDKSLQSENLKQFLQMKNIEFVEKSGNSSPKFVFTKTCFLNVNGKKMSYVEALNWLDQM
ncbi:MAG: hypothetical protein IJA34_00165 [Lachnospiraceae bacterium]|nr:hypothetical protein [Lachnospiraceae bacterium]